MGKAVPRSEMLKADYSSDKSMVSLWRLCERDQLQCLGGRDPLPGIRLAYFTSILFCVGAITIARPKITAMPIVAPLAR
jgi:hypothetical protein